MRESRSRPAPQSRASRRCPRDSADGSGACCRASTGHALCLQGMAQGPAYFTCCALYSAAMPLPPESLVIAALIVAGAFVIFGITGFGSTIVAVPLLAHLLPLKFVIPMFVLLDFGAALRTGFKFHSTIAVRELAWLAPAMLAGIAAGVFLLVKLPGDLILIALGIFVFGYGLYAASGREPSLRLGRAWALPVGGFGGVISALFGAAGPLYVIF